MIVLLCFQVFLGIPYAEPPVRDLRFMVSVFCSVDIGVNNWYFKD